MMDEIIDITQLAVSDDPIPCEWIPASATFAPSVDTSGVRKGTPVRVEIDGSFHYMQVTRRMTLRDGSVRAWFGRPPLDK